jgi:hypothetical protein
MDFAASHRVSELRERMTTMIYVDDDPAERERLMLLASDGPTALDLDREAA